MSRLKTVRLHQEIVFGLDGNDTPYLGEGWAAPEPGRRWTLGGASELRMIHPGTIDLLLEVEAFPLIITPSVAGQRIEVMTNGIAAGTLDLRHHGRLALHIPAGRMPPGQILVLRLVLPDAARPAAFGHSEDQRSLAVCFSLLRLFTLQAAAVGRRVGTGGLQPREFAARTGLAVDVALAGFEGLGETGEFALVRGRAGVKAPSVLLSAAIGLPQLLRGLDAGFAGLGEAGSFDVGLSADDAREYAVTDRIYAAVMRSHQYADEVRLAEFVEQQGARLQDVRRALARLFSEGDKIFVVTGAHLTEQDVLALLIAVNRSNPATLLWVTLADEVHPPGTVEQTTPSLLHGWIDRLQADGDSDALAFDVWLEICANALAMVRGDSERAEAGEGPSGLGTESGRDDPATIMFAEALGQEAGETAELVSQAPATAAGPELGISQSMDAEYEMLQGLTFGEGGNEEAALGFGWSGPETGYRWTEGDSCELWLDHPGDRNVVVAIEAWPLVFPPALEGQRADLSAHDTKLGTLVFTVPARQAVYIPASSLRRGRILRLRIGLPDAARPMDIVESEDDRQLGLGFIRVAVHEVSGQVAAVRIGTGGYSVEDVQARAGLMPEDLLSQFEPLGGTQAFADVQGVFGAGAQSLFRGATVQLIDLIRAIDMKFADLGAPENLQHMPYGEIPDVYEIVDSSVLLSFLAERAVSDVSLEQMMARQARRLKFLRDQLLYQMASGEKIFVYHRAPQEERLTEIVMLPLLMAVRQHGPCTLLFVTDEDETHPAGTVEQTYPGLLHGYLNALQEDEELTRRVWLEICANALAVVTGR